MEFVEEEWKWVNGKSKVIYSLSCDEKFGFGVYLMENYGTNQTKIWMKAFRLLRVLRENLHFTSSWQRTQRSTMEKGKSGSFVKNGNKWMMIYKRATKTERQSLEYATQLAWSSTLLWWQKHHAGSRATSGLTWLQKKTVTEKIGLTRNTSRVHPTIIFKDPTVNKLLIVMTEDENRSPGFVYKSNYELRAVQYGDLRCRDSSVNSLLKKTREIRRTLDNFENLAFWALDLQQPKH